MPTDMLRFFVLALLTLLFSCRNNNRPPDLHEKNVAKCAGFVTSEFNNRRYISSPVSGKLISLTQQKFLKKGSLLFTLRSPEIITLQQHYLEAGNQYEFTRNEYLRQGDLSVENATSLKKMESAKKEYLAAEITMKSLAKQLKILGLNPDNLNSENLTEQVTVYSPCNCYVNRIFSNTGDYLGAGTNIVVLSDKEVRLIKIAIPEEYYFKTAIGNEILYTAAFDSSVKGKTVLHNFESRVDTITHTFSGYAFIEENSPLVTGMSVEAELFLKP